jgi:hypothetical protein
MRAVFVNVGREHTRLDRVSDSVRVLIGLRRHQRRECERYRDGESPRPELRLLGELCQELSKAWHIVLNGKYLLPTFKYVPSCGSLFIISDG